MGELPVSAHPNERTIPLLPALDGLRALAVLAVLLYHADVLWIPGGFLGVEVFFVLSGYLITSLLWGELRSSGLITFREFWRRRARRLLPALFVMLLVVLVVFMAGYPSEIPRIRGDVVAGVGYVSNWYLIGTHHSYFAEFGRPSPFVHLWSLGIEEQFYLLWPILLLGLATIFRGRRRAIASTICVGAAVSMGAMWMLYHGGDPSRVYYGTDTRASGLLLGSALAIVWRPWARGTLIPNISRRALDVATVAAAGGLAWTFVGLDEYGAFTYRIGIPIVSIATAILLACAVHPCARIAGAFGWNPLRAIGRRSYSIYLWHWPVFALLRPGVDLPLDGFPALVLRFGVTLVLAELSFRFIEQPARHGAIGRLTRASRERVRSAIAGAHSSRPAAVRVAVCLGMATAAVVLACGTVTASIVRGAPVANAGVRVTDSFEDVFPISTIAAAPVRSKTRSVARPARARKGSRIPPKGAAALAIGDSVMLGARTQVRAAIHAVFVDAAVARHVNNGIDDLVADAKAAVIPPVVIVHLGTNGIFTMPQFDRIMSILAGARRVVFVNVKVHRRWETSVNRVLATGVRKYPGRAVLVDWHSKWKTCGANIFTADAVHLNPRGAVCYARLIAAAI